MTSQRNQRPRAHLTWRGFLLRWVAAVALVLLTYNPTGTSYVHWVTQFEEGKEALKLLAFALLLGGYAIFIRATARSLGVLGSGLVLATFALLFWVLIDAEIIPKDSRVLLWLSLFVLATFLTIGMTGSYVWRRLTGQYHVSGEEEDMEE